MEILISSFHRMVLNIAIVENHMNKIKSQGSIADISRLAELKIKKIQKSKDVCLNSCLMSSDVDSFISSSDSTSGLLDLF
jgi:hypothetical protein